MIVRDYPFYHAFLFLLDTGHSLAREDKSYNPIEFWDRLLIQKRLLGISSKS